MKLEDIHAGLLAARGLAVPLAGLGKVKVGAVWLPVCVGRTLDVSICSRILRAPLAQNPMTPGSLVYVPGDKSHVLGLLELSYPAPIIPTSCWLALSGLVVLGRKRFIYMVSVPSAL